MAEQIEDEIVPAKRPGFLRRNALVLVTAAVLALVLTVTAWTWLGQHSVLAEQDTRISALKSDLDDAQLAKKEIIAEDVLTALGVSRGRLTTDTAVISALSETIYTWDSAAAYEAGRKTLQDRFDLAADDPFLTTYMPPADFSTDADGKHYYAIDASGLNSSVSGTPTSEVIKVVGSEYSYLVSISVSVTSDSVTQNGSSPDQVATHRTMLLFVTVDADGSVSDLSTVVSSGPTRESK